MFLLKVVADPLGQDRRSEWPEWFALLDPLIQYVFHIGAPRVDDDRAIAQRARSEFHSALEPANDQPIGYVLRGPLGDFPVRMRFVLEPGAVQLRLYLIIREPRPRVSSFHYVVPPSAQRLVIDVITGADSGPTVS